MNPLSSRKTTLRPARRAFFGPRAQTWRVHPARAASCLEAHEGHLCGEGGRRYPRDARSWLETQRAALSSLMASRTVADSIFLAATRLQLLALYALVKAYLYIQFRRRHLWWELRRKGSHLIDPRLVRLARATRRDVERFMRAARHPRSPFAQGLTVT